MAGGEALIKATLVKSFAPQGYIVPEVAHYYKSLLWGFPSTELIALIVT
jgi:hypothetical protein